MKPPSATIIVLHRNVDREIGLPRRCFTLSFRVKNDKTSGMTHFVGPVMGFLFKYFIATSSYVELHITRDTITFITFIAMVINSFIKVYHNKKAKHREALKRKTKTQKTRQQRTRVQGRA
jgi:hypothetical protein